MDAQKGMATWVIEVTELKFEAWCDLQGQLEATMTSYTTMMTEGSNMLMDERVIGIFNH